MKKLEYNIYKCSSFSSVYVPENVKVDNSTDLTSRWCSENIPDQYLTLKLVNTAIVKTITFGKYEQPHICNIKKFRIFGGLDPDHQIELLLEGGLKNDSNNETFELRHNLGVGMIPIRYIKIVPLLTWGVTVNFNFTIWFIELQGIEDPTIIDWNLRYYERCKEQMLARLCLKHFRQRNFINGFRALQQELSIRLEDPLLIDFHDILVENGNFEKAEKFLENIVSMGLFSNYIKKKEYHPVWEQIEVNDDTQIRPGMRGGHQMCIDPYANTIYLFGGWDGNKDLNDLWSYDINTNKWTLLCPDASLEEGPSPRSCHKMVLDTKRKQIFMLGRYLDVQYRSLESLQSDFYMYDIESRKWVLIAKDTRLGGGPFLIFDHQMCMDVDERTLYVFGGRILSLPEHDVDETNPNGILYSGLYCYNVTSSSWRQCLIDIGYQMVSTPSILSRVGHSMLFHPMTRKLYIFAGQRNKEYLNDFLTYHVDNHTVEQIYKGSESESGNFPTPGFTQRATIDPETDEIFVLSGLSKEKEKREDNVQNSVWVFKIRENKWICIYNNENPSETYSRNVEPCPRFAHQLVYDHLTKTHYLFGGNPGRQISPKLRLDDFWKLRICKPTETQILQRCKFLIRKQHFEELAKSDTVAALMYLRTKLSEIVEHQDPTQLNEFHLPASVLFKESQNNEASGSKKEFNFPNIDDERLVDCTETVHFKREQLYEKLIVYFPENMTQPQENLIDYIHSFL